MNTHKYISYSLIYGFKEEVVVLSSDLKVVDANEVFLKKTIDIIFQMYLGNRVMKYYTVVIKYV